jgi:hypothetical protein
MPAADRWGERAGSRDTGRCARCGGVHTARQRCADMAPPVQPPEQPASRAPLRHADHPAQLARRRDSDTFARERPAGGAQHPAVQWLSAIFCSAVLITCLSVAGVYIANLAKAGLDPAVQLAGALIAIALGLLFGVMPLYFTTRAFSGIAYAALALTLVTCGLILVTAAPIVGQMRTDELAAARGSAALLTFGIISTACGAILAAMCVRWSLYRESRARIARWMRASALAYGMLHTLVAGLLVLTSLLVFASDTNDGIDQDVTRNAIVVATLVAGLALPGAALVYHGVGSLRRWPSREARWPVALAGVAAFAAVIGVGHLNMRAATPIAAPMPLLHLLGAALPGITYAAMAARGSLLGGRPVRGLTWRQVSIAAAFSLSVAVAIAIYIEALGSAIAVALLLVRAGAFETAGDSDAVFETIFDSSSFMLSEHEQLAANLIAASLLAPVAEEFAKSLGVRFLMRTSSTRAQCFALGAAAGAAFGFLEALLYGMGWIADDLGAWWQGMAVRAGSTSGHVLWTGVAGVAWWYWARARRHRVAGALFGLAIGAHAAWNGVFTLIDSRIFFLEELSNRAVEIVAYTIVAAWSLAEIAAIPIVGRRLRDAPPPPVEGTPLASMEAWLA